jgi:hypothetical protein
MRPQSARDTRTGTNGDYIVSPERSWPGGFAGILEIPWKFQQKEAGPEKNSRVGTPSYAKSPAKRSFPMSKTTHVALNRGQNGGKWNQRIVSLLPPA